MRGVGVTLGICLWATGAAANPVEQACLAAGRASEPALCTCIGAAASIALDDRDIRTVLGFFRDPQAAQDMRMSDRARDERFWQRYLAFQQIAEDLCG